MQNFLNLFGKQVASKRKSLNMTQRQLADKLYMCVRTIIQIENGKSNSKFETILLIAKELNISIDAILFPDSNPNQISKSVIDFFSGKAENESKLYINLCEQAEQLKKQ